MSAEIVNLRRARKQAARGAREIAAAASRAQHGQSKAERTVRRLEAERAARSLDGARRGPGAPPIDAD